MQTLTSHEDQKDTFKPTASDVTVSSQKVQGQ
jgi:hypothetical protein